MNEAVFPILGPLFVIVLVLPLSALAAKALLWAMSSFDSTSGLHTLHGLRYATIVASSAIPLAWFISASLHQAETGRSALVCTAAHGPGADCAEAAYFSLGLCTLAVLIGVPRLIRDHFVGRAAKTARAQSAQVRVENVIRTRLGLAALEGHVVASDLARVPIVTVGILARRVVVQSAFADSLDDEALAGALFHELEHFSQRDPVRYFLGWWALAINPLGGWLLRTEHARWILRREAHCDRQAVLSGASPAALAKALVLAARAPRASARPALVSGQVEAVKLRLGLLLAYADRAPHRCHHGPALRLVLLVLGLALALPHGTRTDPLDLLHQATERGLALVAGTLVARN